MVPLLCSSLQVSGMLKQDGGNHASQREMLLCTVHGRTFHILPDRLFHKAILLSCYIDHGEGALELPADYCIDRLCKAHSVRTSGEKSVVSLVVFLRGFDLYCTHSVGRQRKSMIHVWFQYFQQDFHKS